jgi:hypothetical protein
MPDITVEPAALRAAAARIEQSLAAVEAARDRLTGATPAPAAGPTAGLTELLRRGHADLLADQHTVLGGLAGTLREDAGRLRQAADRYQDTERQNTIATA